MFSAFLNPFTLIAGGLLVSTPIIIHLINRIRFRRVKWAAMEFLLKAQKRMRRRKILEQLILLFLRCLLVFLVGLLLARFVGCDTGSGKETRPTTHVVVLDDSPSMADGFRREDGSKSDAYSEAKRLVYERLMPATAEATTAQTMMVLRLSDAVTGLGDPKADQSKVKVPLVYPATTRTVDGKTIERTAEEVRESGRVKATSGADLEEAVKLLPVSTVRKSLVDGLRSARKVLDAAPDGDAKVIHIVSDLRTTDWALDGPAISDLLRDYKEAGITVHLIDVGNPVRKVDRKSPAFNDNVSILELKPRNRVVSLNQQTEIDVRVRNNGSTDLKDVALSFYLNGKGNIITSAQIPTLPANQERTHTVTVTFTADEDASAFENLKKQVLEARRAAGKPGMNADEEKEHDLKWRAMSRFRVVTASLANEQSGITADNSRHTVVEVRDKLKVLIVDGRTVENGVDLRTKPEGDSHFLRTLLGTADQGVGNIEIRDGDYNALDKEDLRQYSVVYLMNVPSLSPLAVQRLEKYIREGGGVGVFLGPNVKPDEYNARFYRTNGKHGTGFFPVPLQAEPVYTTELQKKLRLDAFISAKLVRRGPKDHPALAAMYLDERKQELKRDKVEPLFILPNIDAHWAVSRRGQWRDDKEVQELYALQNETPISEFEQRADELVTAVKAKYNEAKFERARRFADPLLELIRSTPKKAAPLSELARLLDQLLCDEINDGHESEPILREFWASPELAEVKQTAKVLRDETKYGDPLYLTKKFYLGRVAVMTTDAGGTYTGKKVWNDWPALGGAAGWVIVVSEMQKYLTGGGDDANRSVGDPFFAEFDFGRYEPNFTAHFLSTSDPAKKAATDRDLTLISRDLDPEKGKPFVMDAPKHPEGTPADAPPRPYQLTHTGAATPGVYLYALKRTKDERPAPKGDGKDVKPDPFGQLLVVAVPYNLDALKEGDLRREATDELEKHTNKAPLHNTEDLSWIEDFKQKPSDLSSRRWIYLLILLILIAEQAWAVRTSYHSRPEDLEALAPSAAAAYAHHSTPTPASAGESAAEPAARA